MNIESIYQKHKAKLELLKSIRAKTIDVLSEDEERSYNELIELSAEICKDLKTIKQALTPQPAIPKQQGIEFIC